MGLGRLSGWAIAFAFGLRRLDAAFTKIEYLGYPSLEPSDFRKLFFGVSHRSHQFIVTNSIQYMHNRRFFRFDA